MSIYLYRNEQQEGPYDLATIKEGLKTGQFGMEDFAFPEGGSDWVPLRTLLPPEPKPPVMPFQDISQNLQSKVDKFDSLVTRLSSDEQDPALVDKMVQKAKDLLTSGEQVEYIGVQKKPLINIAPDAILLTNKRFMIVRPKLMSMSFEDHLWREVVNVHMSEQMLTATITCKVVSGKMLLIDSIPKKQARRIYAYAQEVEERMHEERRKREIEDKRAAAGGVVIHSPVAAASAPPPVPMADDPVAVLGKLKRMLEAGLIEPSEYDTKKAEILARM